jgi:hypothetical protein
MAAVAWRVMAILSKKMASWRLCVNGSGFLSCINVMSAVCGSSLSVAGMAKWLCQNMAAAGGIYPNLSQKIEEKRSGLQWLKAAA